MDPTVALAELNARYADESSASAFDRYDISKCLCVTDHAPWCIGQIAHIKVLRSIEAFKTERFKILFKPDVFYRIIPPQNPGWSNIKLRST
jgi:hypothetical protein